MFVTKQEEGAMNSFGFLKSPNISLLGQNGNRNEMTEVFPTAFIGTGGKLRSPGAESGEQIIHR